MDSDPRVQNLLLKIIDSESTPEEVCMACPELLPQVLQGMKEMLSIAAHVNGLFDEPKSTLVPRKSAAATDEDFPRIPGYEVLSVLGRGGMGVVYKAHHRRLNRPVAVKMLIAGIHARVDERERFLREAEAVAGLHHPNIVQVYDFGDQNGRQYFTMELIEGENLGQKLAGFPQPSKQAATLVATLADAVQAAHKGGIIHRDLKPGNVLLTGEGTPKITDFGLARRVESGPGLTRSGDAMGTPSYMAPEQAQGKIREIGPAVDVYALGAILYELLTGRPPFCGETSAETIQQVLAQDPVPPSRLNAKVPRDLETICLKCLNKDAKGRYASAEKLAADLNHFLSGEPIEARPANIFERSGKWMRRRPAQAMLTAGCFLAAIALTGGGLWYVSAQKAVESAVNDELREAAQSQQRSAWAEASAALERARVRLGESGGSAELRQRLAQSKRDLKWVARMDEIRCIRADMDQVQRAFELSDRAYKDAFREAGLGEFGTSPAEEVAARIRASNIRSAFLAALDDWQNFIGRDAQGTWLQEVALLADPEQKFWRSQVCDQKAWNDAGIVKKLAASALQNQASISALVLIGTHLTQLSTDDGLAFLKRVQREHAGDFWANIALGDELGRKLDYAGAMGCYQTALGLRPGSPVACNKLGCVLAYCNRNEDAKDYFLKAIRLDFKPCGYHRNLAGVLDRLGLHDAALEHYHEAIRLDPDDSLARCKFAVALENKGCHAEAVDAASQTLVLPPDELKAAHPLAHNVIAVNLDRTGKRAEAIEHWKESLRLNPRSGEVHVRLGNALNAAGKKEEALEQWREALAWEPNNPEAIHSLQLNLPRCTQQDELHRYWQRWIETNPATFNEWDGYAELSLFLGKEADYCNARKCLLERFSATTDARMAEQIGRACLLLPQNPELPGALEMQRKAVALIDLALADEKLKKEWPHYYFLFAKGLAEYRQGRFKNACSILQGEASKVLGPAPGLVKAMSQHRLGKSAEARFSFAQAILIFDWSPSKTSDREAWMFHVLRREAEMLIIPNLPLFLDGSYQPKDSNEQIALFGVCKFKRLHHAQARLFADIFATTPRAGETIQLQYHVRAAGAAAMAGCGLGDDCAKLSEAERVAWRKQARDWLNADLDVWKKAFDHASSADLKFMKDALTFWQSEPDLTCVRDAAALDKLPSNERDEWRALWSEVAVLIQRVKDAK